MEILDTKGGVFDEARLAAARALGACIERDDDNPLLGELHAVNISRRLLLAAPNGMGLIITGYLFFSLKFGGK
jgi:hypothetical protein